MAASYIKYIERELARRQQDSGGYSVRRFAKDIKVPHQTLSAILTGRQGLSPQSARKIAAALKLTNLEEKYFIAMVEAKFHRSTSLRRMAAEKLKIIESQLQPNFMASEMFQFISEWYHSAILMMTNLSDFSSEPAWIASRLGISKREAKDAFSRLKSFGLIALGEDGRWRRTHKIIVSRPTGPSKSFQALYSQMFLMAESKMRSLPVDKRELSATFLPLTANDYNFLVKELSDVRRKIMARLQERQEYADEVYCLAMQIFPVTQPKDAK